MYKIISPVLMLVGVGVFVVGLYIQSPGLPLTIQMNTTLSVGTTSPSSSATVSTGAQNTMAPSTPNQQAIQNGMTVIAQPKYHFQISIPTTWNKPEQKYMPSIDPANQPDTEFIGYNDNPKDESRLFDIEFHTGPVANENYFNSLISASAHVDAAAKKDLGAKDFKEELVSLPGAMRAVKFTQTSATGQTYEDLIIYTNSGVYEIRCNAQDEAVLNSFKLLP